MRKLGRDIVVVKKMLDIVTCFVFAELSVNDVQDVLTDGVGHGDRCITHAAERFPTFWPVWGTNLPCALLRRSTGIGRLTS
jgi:hypothetical protein